MLGRCRSLAAPLLAFVPLEYTPDIPTSLVIKEGLYSGATKEEYPILECRTSNSFHGLAVKSLETNSMVIQDSTTGKTVVVVEREGEQMDAVYTIYKTTPTHEGQEVAKKTIEEGSLYTLARVERTSPKDYAVVLRNDTEPTYTLEKAGIPASYATNYYIKQVGVKEEVASTHPWEKGTEMLKVAPGIDATLMYCLASIIDDAKITRDRKDSFSELMSKVNPRLLASKKSSSSE